MHKAGGNGPPSEEPQLAELQEICTVATTGRQYNAEYGYPQPNPNLGMQLAHTQTQGVSVTFVKPTLKANRALSQNRSTQSRKGC